MRSHLVTEWYDRETGATGYLALDESIDGLSGGGIRMRPGLQKLEVQRLARTMTLKLVGLGMPIGGGKAGIDYDPLAPDAFEVLQRFLQAHKPLLMHSWGASEDMGTSKADIFTIARGMGMTSAVDAFFAPQPDPEAAARDLTAAINLTVGDAPITDIITGAGVAASVEATLESLGVPVAQARVAIQGFGSVGAGTAAYLHDVGVTIVAVSDVHGTVSSEEGLDIPLLLAAKDAKGNIDRAALPSSYETAAGSAWMQHEVDVLVPAAVADAIDDANVMQVRAKAIVEGANIPTTESAERTLGERGIAVVPDFIANSAGAGLFGSVLYMDLRPDADEIISALRDRIAQSTTQILDMAKTDGISPREAAVRLNEMRISQMTGSAVTS